MMHIIQASKYALDELKQDSYARDSESMCDTVDVAIQQEKVGNILKMYHQKSLKITKTQFIDTMRPRNKVLQNGGSRNMKTSSSSEQVK